MPSQFRSDQARPGQVRSG